jgi:hypothetical protein
MAHGTYGMESNWPLRYNFSWRLVFKVAAGSPDRFVGGGGGGELNLHNFIFGRGGSWLRDKTNKICLTRQQTELYVIIDIYATNVVLFYHNRVRRSLYRPILLVNCI